mgnify:CR=1 FL=1
MKVSLGMFAIAVFVFFLALTVSLLNSQKHFYAEAVDHASQALSTSVARAERSLRSVETAAMATAQMARFASDGSASSGPDTFPGDYGWHAGVSDRKTATYSLPVFDRNGRQKGVVSSDLSLPDFSMAISAEMPYPNSFLIILGEDGRFLAHRDTAKIIGSTIFDPSEGTLSRDKLSLGLEMTTGGHGAMRAEVEGVRCLICYQSIPGTTWSAALISPMREVMHRYNRLNVIIFAVSFIGLLIIFLICRSIVAEAFEPLKLLEEQTRRITGGDYYTVVARSSVNSVVGHLQNSFADMQEAISSHMRDVNMVIAETARHNDELQLANASLEEAIRRQNTFVANMTHQIRTPLNLIMGFSQLLRDSGQGMPEGERLSVLNVINYYTMILNRMSLMLYDSSDKGLREEQQSLRYDLVSCNGVARECLAYSNRYYPGVPVRFETALDDSFTILADHLYLMRSIREILFNSAKYSDGKNVSLRVSADSETVRFVFEDTGPGIPHEYQENVFTPFYKMDDLSEGLGVGLPLTKRHVTFLGGSLELDKDYTEGCRIVMEFPFSRI